MLLGACYSYSGALGAGVAHRRKISRLFEYIFEGI